MDDLDIARGFSQVKIVVDKKKPLTTGCWLPRAGEIDSWIEFRYERLQDFYYKYGCIDHVNTNCSYPLSRGGFAGYGELRRLGDLMMSKKIDKPV